MTQQLNVETWIEAKLTNVNVRSELHGDDDVPAIDYTFEADLDAEFVDQIDPEIREMFCEFEKTETVPGVPRKATRVRGKGLIEMPIACSKAYQGYILEMDYGGEGSSSNLRVGDCAVNKFRFEFRDGGNVRAKWRVQASGVSRDVIGISGTLIRHMLKIKMRAPTVKDEKDKAAFNAAKAKEKAGSAPDAGTVFADAEAAGKNKPAADVPAKKVVPIKKTAGRGNK